MLSRKVNQSFIAGYKVGWLCGRLDNESLMFCFDNLSTGYQGTTVLRLVYIMCK